MADGSTNLKAGFEIGQGSQILLARFRLRQETRDLNATFIVRGEASVDLSSEFRVKNCLDFSDSFGITFRWYGSGHDVNVDLVLRTPTGNFVASFGDGPAEWRRIYIPWSRFRETGIDGSRPDKSRICCILWTVHTSGTWRVDRVTTWSCPELPARFVVRQDATRDLKSGFDSQVTEDLSAELIVRHSGTQDLPASFRLRQGVEDLSAELIVLQSGSEELACGMLVRGAGTLDLPAAFEIS